SASLTPPLAGNTITWSAIGDEAPTTVWPRFTCFTGGLSSNYPQMVFNNPPVLGCQPSDSLTCITDSSGGCSVVYRRLRDTPGDSLAPAVGPHALALTAGPWPVSPTTLVLNVMNP